MGAYKVCETHQIVTLELLFLGRFFSLSMIRSPCLRQRSFDSLVLNGHEVTFFDYFSALPAEWTAVCGAFLLSPWLGCLQWRDVLAESHGFLHVYQLGQQEIGTTGFLHAMLLSTLYAFAHRCSLFPVLSTTFATLLLFCVESPLSQNLLPACPL